jgi:O-antigen ligase
LSARPPLRLAAVALAAPLLLFPLLLAPALGLGAGVGALALLLAWVSPAIPLGLASAGDLVPLLGSVQPPGNAVVVALFVWTVAGTVFAVTRAPERLPAGIVAAPVLLSMALLAIMMIRLTDTPAEQYGSDKLKLFVVVNVTVLAAGVIVGRRRRDVELCLALTCAIAVIGAVALLISIISGAEPVFTGRYALSEDDPIALGRLSAAGLLIALYALLTARSAVGSLALCAVPVLLVALLSSGSRGPFIGLVLGLVVLWGLLARGERTAGRRPLLVGAVILAVAFASQLVPGAALERAASLLVGGVAGQDANGRAELWAQAWQIFLERPWLGVGTGGFAAAAPGDVYPHNLLLETAAEWGLVGLVALGGILMIGVAQIVRAVRRPPPGERGLAVIVAALFTAALANAMFSGDITANSSVWLTLGLGLGLASRSRSDP